MTKGVHVGNTTGRPVQPQQWPNRRLPEALLAGGLVLFALWLVTSFLERFPAFPGFGIDWALFHGAMEGGQFSYAATGFGMRNPPWTFLALLPFAPFSFKTSWGLWALLTLCILLLSVPRAPRRWQRLAAAILLLGTHISLRHLSDGNLEGLVILGALLLVSGYNGREEGSGAKYLLWTAFGLLLVTVKPQNAWLLVLVFAVQLLRTWPPHRWLRLGLLVAAVALLWRGAQWLEALTYQAQQRGGLVDVSLSATLGRLGLESLGWPLSIGLLLVTVLVALRTPDFDRAQAALLVIVSVLLAPYAGGFSALSVIALGTGALLPIRPRLALALIAATYLSYALPSSLNPTYVSLILLAYWATLALGLGRGWFVGATGGPHSAYRVVNREHLVQEESDPALSRRAERRRMD
jgi:hypothetical protein